MTYHIYNFIQFILGSNFRGGTKPGKYFVVIQKIIKLANDTNKPGMGKDQINKKINKIKTILSQSDDAKDLLGSIGYYFTVHGINPIDEYPLIKDIFPVPEWALDEETI